MPADERKRETICERTWGVISWGHETEDAVPGEKLGCTVEPVLASVKDLLDQGDVGNVQAQLGGTSSRGSTLQSREQ
jgi:hypothetical protein